MTDQTNYRKENDYILSAANNMPYPAEGSLCRYFNFASKQITVIYSNEKTTSTKAYSAPDYIRQFGGKSDVSTSSAIALTSQMQIQNFADIPSQDEIKLMHAKLKDMGGNPPTL